MEIDYNKFFKLYANCVPVRGYRESVVMDLQRSGFLIISNLLFDVLKTNQESISIGQLKKKYLGKYDQGIDNYIKYFMNEEMGFCTEEPEKFPNLVTHFYQPFKIVSSVINFKIKGTYSLEKILIQLITLDTQLIQLRIFDNIDLESLLEIIAVIKKSRIKIFEIFLKENQFSLNDLFKLTKTDGRVEIVVYSSSSDEPKKEILLENRVHFIKEKIRPNSKEKFNEKIFVSNIPFYVESLSYNVGLNRKICVDLDGSIKNFVNHKLVFGNVNNVSLNEILDNDEFKWKWLINNDLIEKCKDCQFRYMCLNNSDIVKKGKKYYRLDNCGFDPYQNKWQ